MPDYEEIIKKLWRPRDEVIRPRREGESHQKYRRRSGRHHKALRNWHSVHQRDLCYFCGTTMQSKPSKADWDLKRTLEHLETFSTTGHNTVENTAASCAGCNWARGTIPLEEFKANYREFRDAYVAKVNKNRAMREKENAKNIVKILR